MRDGLLQLRAKGLHGFVKILWVNANFLHPTTKGGQIRTLEMLKCLHRRHEMHYVAIENPNEPEGTRPGTRIFDQSLSSPIECPG